MSLLLIGSGRGFRGRVKDAKIFSLLQTDLYTWIAHFMNEPDFRREMN